MTTDPEIITCLLCREEVDFTHMENKSYLYHLKSNHHIEHYLHFTFMVTLMDESCLDYLSTMTLSSYPKTVVCLLCWKENMFCNEEGYDFFSHLRNVHMITFNLQLIRSINLMDKNDLRGIIKKFEESYEVDDEENNINGNNSEHIFAINDDTNLAKKTKNDEEKMLIEDGSTFDNSITTSESEHEKMFGELEEELMNSSEAINYYKSQSVDADMAKQANLDYQQSETLLNNSKNANISVHNDLNLAEDSKAPLNDSPYSANSVPIKKPFMKGLNNYGVESSDFSGAVLKEIEKGNLSTSMDIPYEQTHKIMRKITGMFMKGMKGTTCTICDKMSNNKLNLHSHIESLHNPIPVYFCNLCQFPMTSSTKYRAHRNKMHKFDKFDAI